MAAPLVFFAALSAGANIYSAYSNKKSANKEAAAYVEQAKIQYVESLRDAELIKYKGEIFAQRQSLQYIASGVILGGSALITLEQTRRFANEEANATARRGAAGLRLAYEKEQITQNQGNASVIGSLITGVTSVLSTGYGGEK